MAQNSTDQRLFVLQQNMLPFLLGTVIILFNLLALRILAQSIKMNFQIKVMTMNLALTDLLTGVAILLDSFLSPVLPEYLCRPLMYLYCIGVVVSFTTITGLLVDRFVAIFYPFRYQTIVLQEKKFSFAAVLLLWVAGVFLSAVNFIDGFKIYGSARTAVCASYIMTGRAGLATVTMVFCFLLISNVFLYMLMFMKISKLSKAVHPSDNLRNWYLYRTQTRVLFKLSAITVSFMLLYIPSIVLNTIVVFNNNLARTLVSWQSLAGCLILLNAFLNPFLFVLRFTECRYTFLSIVCFACKSQREKYQNLKKRFVVSFLEEPMMSNNTDVRVLYGTRPL